MKVFESENKCCGCSACEQICPKKAIKMAENEKGFLYPVVDAELCVNCNKCQSVCPYHNEIPTVCNVLSAFIFQHNSDTVLKKSSSGGFFTAISDYVLDNGGVVFGSVIDDYTFDVHHICAETAEDRDKMRGSKYVQSNTQGTFIEVKEFLESGKQVLFTGTPCQNAALISFLGEKSNNLILVDLLCHGVPSNKLLKEYLQGLQKKYKNSIKSFSYRTKKYIYNPIYAESCELELENGKHKNPVNLKTILDVYTLNMREACYGCKFASLHRFGDFTIGDFFDESPVKVNEKGYSVVFINSEKGMSVSKSIFDNNNASEIIVNDIRTSSLYGGVKRKKKVDGFWNCYSDNGLDTALKKYSNYGYLTTVKRQFSRICYYLKIYKWFI